MADEQIPGQTQEEYSRYRGLEASGSIRVQGARCGLVLSGAGAGREGCDEAQEAGRGGRGGSGLSTTEGTVCQASP